MALRIEAWLGVARGGEARLWLAEQSAYDIWQAAQRVLAFEPATCGRLCAALTFVSIADGAS